MERIVGLIEWVNCHPMQDGDEIDQLNLYHEFQEKIETLLKKENS